MNGAATKSVARRMAAANALTKRLDAKNPQRDLSTRTARALGLIQRLDQWPGRERAKRQDRLADRERRLAGALTAIVTARERALERGIMRLDALDPFEPLERGYAVILKGDRVVRDATQLAPGDAIAARMARGTVAASVESVDLHE
jgi:exodeoxyribonuclease VII large subunit